MPAAPTLITQVLAAIRPRFVGPDTLPAANRFECPVCSGMWSVPTGTPATLELEDAHAPDCAWWVLHSTLRAALPAAYTLEATA